VAEAKRDEDMTTPAPGVPPGLIGIEGLAESMDLDRLIHERVRLGIVSALAVNETLSFNDLKALLDVTDGNLSAHARKLEDAGYLLCEKGYRDRVPRTEYRLTAAGRAALEDYLEHMEALIRAVKEL
jgi:DNA-binding MarR family transcriptional regulator